MAAALTERSDVRDVLADTSWQLGVGGLLVTAVSYVAIGRRFAMVDRLVGVGSGGRMLAELGYTSTILGRVIVGGGTTSNLLRITVLGRYGIPMGDTVAASLLHSYMNFVLVLVVFSRGLGLVLVGGGIGVAHTAGLAAAGAAVFLLISAFSAVLFVPRLRQVLIRSAVSIGRRCTGKNLVEHGERFNASVGGAVSAVQHRRSSLAAPSVLLLLEALGAITALWFAFAAIGVSVSPHLLVAGFGIGTAAAMASMIPGGLGVQEGPMTGVFALLGIDFDHALAATVLFRVIYFFVPFAVSLFFYRRLTKVPQAAGFLAAA